ncbi:MAG: radical SAM protein [Desulfobacterales bacterium]
MSPDTQRPFIIPVFLPHAGCPHRCAFCDQKIITGHPRTIPSSKQFRSTVRTFLGYKGSRRNPVQISFYGGNFLGLEKKDIAFLLNEATEFIHEGVVESIRFSTRPDTISTRNLDLIRDYPVSTIELGTQSMNDRVLEEVERGHTARDTVNAVDRLRGREYEIGIQMMVGLPTDDRTGAIKTTREIADLSPDFVRIYPTIVLANSRLAIWFEEGNYTPMPLAECVTLVKELYDVFQRQNIPVIRMGLQSSTDLDDPGTVLAGPYHPAFGHLVLSERFLDKASATIASMNHPGNRIGLVVHPGNIPKIRGFKNQNIAILKRKFHIESLEITSDVTVGKDQVVAIPGQYVQNR